VSSSLVNRQGAAWPRRLLPVSTSPAPVRHERRALPSSPLPLLSINATRSPPDTGNGSQPARDGRFATDKQYAGTRPAGRPRGMHATPAYAVASPRLQHRPPRAGRCAPRFRTLPRSDSHCLTTHSPVAAAAAVSFRSRNPVRGGASSPRER
jgi:hypothetical protein